MNKEPLLAETQTPPRGSEKKVQSVQSRHSRQSKVKSVRSGSTHQNEKFLYSLPDMTNVTRTVMGKLIAVSIVCIIFLAAEVVGGMLAQSLAILSDAAHLFSDMSGFFISIFSIWLGQKPASEMLSFGYHRAEVIGALGSIILIWGLTIILFYEATMRIIDKAIVKDPLIMVITASFGLFCNLVMAKVLHSSPGGHDNIMHQCDGHDHNHGDAHDHANEGHDHAHDHKHNHSHSKTKKTKKVTRKIKKEHGISMLIVEQDFSSSQSEVVPIEEDSKEQSNDHNHSQNCIEDEENKKDVRTSHVHSDRCDHPSSKIEPPIDMNQDSHLDIPQGGCCDGKEKKQVKQQDKGKQKQTTKNQSHVHDHKHDHNHDHDHDHEGHDHDHDHGHNHEDEHGTNLAKVGAHDNVNLKAAMIHIIGDIVQSIGVLIAALIIYFCVDNPEIFSPWQYADPICTYIFSILVMFTTFGVSKECLKVLMEGTPTGMIAQEFKVKLEAIPRVKEVHDLHIWSLSVGKPSMSAHIVVTENPEYVLKKATILCRQFGIYHSTIQIELENRQGQSDYIKCDHNIHH